MILAYPTNKEGNPIGGERAFTEGEWAKLQKIKNLRWKELPEIENDYSYDNLKRMTKRQLVTQFELPNDDMLLLKSEIIKKITE